MYAFLYYMGALTYVKYDTTKTLNVFYIKLWNFKILKFRNNKSNFKFQMKLLDKNILMFYSNNLI